MRGPARPSTPSIDSIRYRHNLRKTVFFVDESSNLTSRHLERSRGGSSSAPASSSRHFKGQFLPIGGDPATRFKIEDSRVYQQPWDNHLPRPASSACNRRCAGDQLQLRPGTSPSDDHVGDPRRARRVVADYHLWYPWPHARSSTCSSALATASAIYLNGLCNAKATMERHNTKFIPKVAGEEYPLQGLTNQPQDMVVYPGLELVRELRAATGKIMNNVRIPRQVPHGHRDHRGRRTPSLGRRGSATTAT
jgi:hypothetical protein